MPIVHLFPKIDVLKMEQEFKANYQERNKKIYVSPLNQKGEEEFQDQHMSYWNRHWMFENERFESFLLVDLDLKFFYKHIFFVWDGNHRLQVWLPYINHLQDDEPFQHIFVDSIVLDTSHGFIELLITMMELNKYVIDPSFVSIIKLNLEDFVLIPLCIFVGWWSWTA